MLVDIETLKLLNQCHLLIFTMSSLLPSHNRFTSLKCDTERFRADDLLQDAREDCYLSTLQIHHTSVHDARPYYLVVENERGTDRHAIQLNVEGTFTGAEQL